MSQSLLVRVQKVVAFIQWIAKSKSISNDEAASYFILLRETDKEASNALLNEYLRSSN